MDRQGIADQCDRTVDALADHRRRDVDTLLHRQDVVVVLVAHRAVETHFGRVFVLAQKHLPEVTRLLCVEDAVSPLRTDSLPLVSKIYWRESADNAIIDAP